MKIVKEERELLKFLWNHGCQVSASHRNGKGHLCLLLPDNSIYSISKTPSDRRGRLNALSDIRKKSE